MCCMNHTCTNCGADKHGELCAVCGQNSRDYLRSAFRVGYEFLTEVFDVEETEWGLRIPQTYSAKPTSAS